MNYLKKTIPFILCLFLFFSYSAFAKVSIENINGSTIYDFEIEGLKYSPTSLSGKTYQEVNLEGIDGYQGILYSVGEPEIPVIRLYISARNVNDITVIVPEVEGVVGLLPLSIPPSQESQPKIPNAVNKFKKNQTTYRTNSFVPQKSFQIDNTGSINGVKRFLVTLYPLTYNPVTNETKLRSNYKVVVKGVKKSVTNRGAEKFIFLVGQQFDNSPSLATYIDYKKMLGYDVKKIVVASGDNANTLRAKIKSIYSDGNLKYLLIVGDIDDVPSHRAGNISGVTDHFYRAIDTDNYDTDINGPDIGVGRITPKNEDELSIIVNKFIKYQNGDFAEEEWLKHISFIGTDDKWQIAEGSHNYVIDTHTKNRGYKGVFPQANMEGGDKLYAITYKATGTKVVQTVNLGRTIINYSGHGAKTYWAGPKVTQSDVRGLNHGDALPFVISNACITGDFRTNESFGETWIKDPHGAIMFWGSMDSSYWGEDDILEKRMYDGIFFNNNLAFNKITQHALAEHWKHYGGNGKSKYYWETYVTFGDPSILLRTTKTKEVSILGTSTIPIGIPDASFTITDSEGNLIKGAQVILQLAESDYAVSKISDEDGKVTLPLGPGIVGSVYTLSVYGPNLKISQSEVKIIASDSAYLQLKELTVNDRPTSEVSPFEEVKVNFLIKNLSPVGTSGGAITVDSIEGPATLITGNVDVPALAGEEIFNYQGNGLAFKVGDANNGDLITLNIKWEIDEGKGAIISHHFKVQRGVLEIVSVDFGDPTNPQTGGMSPGESGEIFLTVKNTGSEPLKNVALEGIATTCLSDIQGSIVFNNLMPGNTIRLVDPVGVSLNNECVNNDLAKFKLQGTYDSRVTEVDLLAESSFVVGKIGLAEYLDANLNLEIPDNSVLYTPFEFAGLASIKEINIHVKITHPYIGDISIALIDSNGGRYVLRNKSGGSADNLNQVFDSAEHPELKKVIGKPTSGTWKLEVRDNANRDAGTLDYLRVSAKGIKI